MVITFGEAFWFILIPFQCSFKTVLLTESQTCIFSYAIVPPLLVFLSHDATLIHNTSGRCIFTVIFTKQGFTTLIYLEFGVIGFQILFLSDVYQCLNAYFLHSFSLATSSCSYRLSLTFL